jgi:hypothetical protein
MLIDLNLRVYDAAAALEDARVNFEQVQEVYMGNVYSAGLGQAPARQAALVCSLINLELMDSLKRFLACTHYQMLVAVRQKNFVVQTGGAP